MLIIEPTKFPRISLAPIWLIIFILAVLIGCTVPNLQSERDEKYEIALDQIASQDYEGAIVTLTEIIHTSPEFHQAYYARGVASSDLGRYEDAIKDYQAYISVDSSNASAYLNLGVAHFHNGDILAAKV